MRFLEMTAPRLRGLNKAQTLVLLPIAAVEQHGPHAPTGTDTIICGSVAEAVEQNYPESVLLLPTLWLGASHHHLRYGATLSAALPLYTGLLEAILEPLLDDGFRRAMILNGHGGNVDPLRSALRNLQSRHFNCLLAGASYWSIADAEIVALLEGEPKSLGHADEAETSLIRHLRPELIDDEAIQDTGRLVPDVIEGMFVCRDMRQRTQTGATGRPDLATAEKGGQLFEAIAARVGVAVSRMLEEPLPQ